MLVMAFLEFQRKSQSTCQTYVTWQDSNSKLCLLCCGQELKSLPTFFSFSSFCLPLESLAVPWCKFNLGISQRCKGRLYTDLCAFMRRIYRIWGEIICSHICDSFLSSHSYISWFNLLTPLANTMPAFSLNFSIDWKMPSKEIKTIQTWILPSAVPFFQESNPMSATFLSLPSAFK